VRISVSVLTVLVRIQLSSKLNICGAEEPDHLSGVLGNLHYK
jgi:hypothetical protein